MKSGIIFYCHLRLIKSLSIYISLFLLPIFLVGQNNTIELYDTSISLPQIPNYADLYNEDSDLKNNIDKTEYKSNQVYAFYYYVDNDAYIIDNSRSIKVYGLRDIEKGNFSDDDLQKLFNKYNEYFNNRMDFDTIKKKIESKFPNLDYNKPILIEAFKENKLNSFYFISKINDDIFYMSLNHILIKGKMIFYSCHSKFDISKFDEFKDFNNNFGNSFLKIN